MTFTDAQLNRVRKVARVAYVSEWKGFVRVVFHHSAETDDIRRVVEIMGTEGELQATQEHEPAVRFDR